MSLVNSSIGGYRLDAFIGAGGMGEVYRSVHPALGRVVAIKVLAAAAMDPKSAQRFQNEARIQAGLRHPGIVTLYEFLEYQGRPCIVMEYVEGETLANRLRTRGPIPAAEAMAIFRKVVEAVAYIHGEGVIHRDLKSNNIKITPSGEVRILDFGIAKSRMSGRVTQLGAVIGTTENLAPEQIEGRTADFRTDIWALGILLYEMVTARAPFEGAPVQRLYDQILKTEPPLASAQAPGVPREVDAIVERCLKKDPEQRFRSASELLEALGTQATAGPRPGVPPARLRYILIAAAVLLLAIIGLVAFRDGNGGQISDGTEIAGAAQGITVDVVGGSAEVWRDGRRAGKTPFQIQARQGDRIDVLLKREGYQDLPVQFDVSERKVYSYTMEPAR